MRSGTVNSSLTRGYGTLGGLTIIGAALFAVPSTLLLEPLPPAESYLSTLAALTTGLVCIALPWERLDPRWLHLFGVLATIEAAWGVAVFGQAYMALYFVFAVAVAYVTPDAKSLLPHLLLLGLALFGPVLYGPDVEPREALQVALVVYPLLVFTTGIFAYLRQRMVADHRSYRRFAEETLALADRIAGRSTSTQQTSTQQPAIAGELDDLPDWSRFRVSGRAAAAAAAIFAIPLLSAGLAVAGVKLPGFAAETFGEVGIDLPNQGDAQDSAAAATSQRRVQPSRTEGSSAAEPEAAASRAADRSASSGGGQRESSSQGGEDVTTTEVASGASGGGAPPTASGSEPPDEGPPAAQVDGDSGAGVSQPPSLGQALEDTLAGLGGLLGGNKETGEAGAGESAE